MNDNQIYFKVLKTLSNNAIGGAMNVFPAFKKFKQHHDKPGTVFGYSRWVLICDFLEVMHKNGDVYFINTDLRNIDSTEEWLHEYVIMAAITKQGYLLYQEHIKSIKTRRLSIIAIIIAGMAMLASAATFFKDKLLKQEQNKIPPQKTYLKSPPIPSPKQEPPNKKF